MRAGREAATSFRQRVRARERVLGTVVASADLGLAEHAAGELDFLWIDLEHSPLHVGHVQALSIAASAAGCGSLVRLPAVGSELVTPLLDAGVDGVVFPRVEEVGTARAAAAALRYPPRGTRGFASRRANHFGAGDDRAPEPLCLVQLESAKAVAAAAEIAAVEGVDGIIVGPNDLALDLGVAPGLDVDRIAAALATVGAAAERAGVVAGLAAGGSAELAASAAGEHYSLLAYSADVRIYTAALAAAARSARAAWC